MTYKKMKRSVVETRLHLHSLRREEAERQIAIYAAEVNELAQRLSKSRAALRRYKRQKYRSERLVRQMEIRLARLDRDRS